MALSRKPRQSKSQQCVDKGDTRRNIFECFRETYGNGCFETESTMKQIRLALKSYITGNNCYGIVLSFIVEDAIQFHQNYLSAKNKTLDIMREYNEQSDTFCECDSNHCCAHEVLIIAANICDKYNFKDAVLVKKLMLAIYKCDCGFDRFFNFLDPLIFPFEIDSALYRMNHNAIGEISQTHLEYSQTHSRVFSQRWS